MLILAFYYQYLKKVKLNQGRFLLMILLFWKKIRKHLASKPWKLTKFFLVVNSPLFWTCKKWKLWGPFPKLLTTRVYLESHENRGKSLEWKKNSFTIFGLVSFFQILCIHHTVFKKPKLSLALNCYLKLSSKIFWL